MIKTKHKFYLLKQSNGITDRTQTARRYGKQPKI